MHVLGADTFSIPTRNEPARHADTSVETAVVPPEGGWSVWYLTDEDDVGESIEQGIIIRQLLAVLTELARERGWARVLVGSDQFFAWVEPEPLVRISPDVYIVDDPPDAPPRSFQMWRRGHRPPRFAVEVASTDLHKDHVDAPPKYAQLGTRELVIFDPAPRGRRVALQVYRLQPDGTFARVEAGPGPVHSVELDAWLVVAPDRTLRIARDPAGTDLVPTPEEQLVVQRAENAAQKQQLAAQRDELAALRRELDALRGR